MTQFDAMDEILALAKSRDVSIQDVFAYQALVDTRDEFDKMTQAQRDECDAPNLLEYIHMNERTEFDDLDLLAHHFAQQFEFGIKRGWIDANEYARAEKRWEREDVFGNAGDDE